MSRTHSQSRENDSPQKMKRLPSNRFEMRNEAVSLGLLVPNPTLDKPRSKLLSFVNDSTRISRSSYFASILLVGSSGVGKSSTINHLLNIGGKGVQFAETSEKRSETRVTSEFIVTADDQKYLVEDLELGIVDSPGFNDTDGYRQDASNFYSIKMFYQTHPKVAGCYPNLIFLLVPATDTRIEGENSNLAKSLRCLNELRLVDHLDPNVVAILSFCCSVSYKNVEKWKEKMENKRKSVQDVIFNALRVTAPVVLLENNYADEELEVVGEFTRLPDGKLQPKNLYDACENVLRKNKDNLGLVILNACFSKLKSKAPMPGHGTAAKDASKVRLSAEEEGFVKFFEKAARGGSKDPIFDTAQQFIKEKNLDKEQQREVQEIASSLKRMGLQEKDDCSLVSEGSVRYFHAHTISPTGTEMLEKEFKIIKRATNIKSDDGEQTVLTEKKDREKWLNVILRTREMTLELKKRVEANNILVCERHFEPDCIFISRIVGQGYNILNDKSTACEIMKYETAETDFGIVIPTCAKFEKVNETRSIMDQYEDENSYTRARLSKLNVSLDVECELFNMETKAGYNRKKESKHERSVSEYSFLFEQRMFELKIANFREYMEKGITFTADFISAVESLPVNYDKNDSSNRSQFERFFNKFGHFMVTSAYGGGAIEAKITNQNSGSEIPSFEEAKACLSASFDGGLWRASAGASGSDSLSTSKKSSAILSQSSLNWYGGNRDLQIWATVENQEQMLKWRASLLDNPAILTTEMCLEPVSTAVSCVDPNKDQASYDALKDLLGGEFKVLASREKEREEEKRKREEKQRRAEEAKTREDAVQQPTSGGSCFPSSSMVHVEDIDGSFVRKKIIDVSVGDKVIAWDVKRNRSVSSKVVMFAHWEPAAIDVEYVKIVLQDSSSIVLSSNHLVMMGERLQATMAQNVQPGHILYTIDEKRSLSPQQVLAVQTIVDTGMFCPITTEGNLVVDNVLASCYASVNDQVFLNGLIKLPAQKIAHLGLLPMRFLNKLNVKWIAKLPKDECIHPYVKWLCKLKLPWMDTALELN